MYEFEKWLVGRFPRPGAKAIDGFRKAFPNSPEYLVEFFTRVSGGSLRVNCEAIDSYPIGTHSVGTNWPRDVSASYELYVLSGRRTELMDFRPFNSLVPIFEGESHCEIFFYCETGEVLKEEDEEGKVTVLADSLDAYCNSIQRMPLQDYERGNELDNLVHLCEDERILEFNDTELHSFRSDVPSMKDSQLNLLHVATLFNRSDLAKALVKRGLDPLETDAFENNCIHLAANVNSIDCLKFFTKLHPEALNRQNAKKETAFQLAVNFRAARSAIWLIHEGAEMHMERNELLGLLDGKQPQLFGYLKDGSFGVDLETE